MIFTVFTLLQKLTVLYYQQQRCRTKTSRSRTSCRSGWPRGLGELNPSPHSWIFTSVSVDSNPRSNLFTSATARIPVHTCSHYTKVWHRTYPICDPPLSRLAQLRFDTEIALKSLFLCLNRSSTPFLCQRKSYPVQRVRGPNAPHTQTQIVKNTTLMKTQTCTRQHVFDQHNESQSHQGLVKIKLVSKNLPPPPQKKKIETLNHCRSGN